MTCANDTITKTGINVSSDLTWNYANGATSLNALVDGVDLSTYVVNPGNVSFNNKTVLQFDLPRPKVLTLIELGNYPNQSPLVAGGTYKLQGFDGTNWVDIVSSQVIANTAKKYATNNSVKFDMSANITPYGKYRVYGISLTGFTQWANEVYFEERTCSDKDTDGDGIVNRLDLDSDNDGCSDAKEGASFSVNSGVSFSSSTAAGVVTGTTLQNAQITGEVFGTNGLSNFLETNKDNGIINYTSFYNKYAIDNAKIICNEIDTDGDGIVNLIDIDDDNDGILDKLVRIILI